MQTRSSHPAARGRRSPRRLVRAAPRSGLSLLEVTIVVAVLTCTFLAMSRSLGQSMQLNEANRESALALDAAREVIETLSGSEDFDELFRAYNLDPDDDPAGAGTAPGARFAVRGLDPDPDDPDGFVGEVSFPVALGASGRLELQEGVDDPGLGMPRDLDADGVVEDGVDQSDSYRLLPVRVVVRWRGGSGPRTLEIRTLIADR